MPLSPHRPAYALCLTVFFEILVLTPFSLFLHRTPAASPLSTPNGRRQRGRLQVLRGACRNQPCEGVHCLLRLANVPPRVHPILTLLSQATPVLSPAHRVCVGGALRLFRRSPHHLQQLQAQLRLGRHGSVSARRDASMGNGPSPILPPSSTLLPLPFPVT